MSEVTLVRYKPSLAKLLDTWRSQQNDFPSRADAIRRLTAQALAAAGLRLSDEDIGAEPKAKKPTEKKGKRASPT